jgi:predicted Zn-dependent protease
VVGRSADRAGAGRGLKTHAAVASARIPRTVTDSMSSRLEHFSNLVAAQPDNELFRFSLAQALLADGRAADAEPHLAFCVAKKSDWMLPRILLGRHRLAAGRTADARRLLEEALALAIAQQHKDPEHELRALLADLPPAPAA